MYAVIVKKCVISIRLVEYILSYHFQILCTKCINRMDKCGYLWHVNFNFACILFNLYIIYFASHSNSYLVLRVFHCSPLLKAFFMLPSILTLLFLDTLHCEHSLSQAVHHLAGSLYIICQSLGDVICQSLGDVIWFLLLLCPRPIVSYVSCGTVVTSAPIPELFPAPVTGQSTVQFDASVRLLPVLACFLFFIVCMFWHRHVPWGGSVDAGGDV